VAAARLGAKVALIGCVGNDDFGRDAIRHYRAEGIDTSFVRHDANCPAGTAAIVVDDNAENCIIVVAGANANLSPEDVCRAAPVIQNADAVLCQLETPLVATLEVFRLARAAGVLTMLTPAPAKDLPDELLALALLLFHSLRLLPGDAACRLFQRTRRFSKRGTKACADA